MATCKNCGGTIGVHAHIDALNGWYCDICCPLCRYAEDFSDMARIEAPKTACGKTEMCEPCKAKGGCGDGCGPTKGYNWAGDEDGWAGELDGENN